MIKYIYIYTYSFRFLAPPKIIDITVESNSNEIFKENEQIILKCLARGIPQPKITWHIQGKKFQLNKRNDRSKKKFKEIFYEKKKENFFFLLDIITYENKLLIKNFSRTTPVDYQCIADNGIPPRDTRTKHLFPYSKYLFFPCACMCLLHKILSFERILLSIMTQLSKLSSKEKLFSFSTQ